MEIILHAFYQHNGIHHWLSERLAAQLTTLRSQFNDERIILVAGRNFNEIAAIAKEYNVECFYNDKWTDTHEAFNVGTALANVSLSHNILVIPSNTAWAGDLELKAGNTILVGGGSENEPYTNISQNLVCGFTYKKDLRFNNCNTRYSNIFTLSHKNVLAFTEICLQNPRIMVRECIEEFAAKYEMPFNVSGFTNGVFRVWEEKPGLEFTPDISPPAKKKENRQIIRELIALNPTITDVQIVERTNIKLGHVRRCMRSLSKKKAGDTPCPKTKPRPKSKKDKIIECWLGNPKLSPDELAAIYLE